MATVQDTTSAAANLVAVSHSVIRENAGAPDGTGLRYIPATACYYPPAVHSKDILLVDFDVKTIQEEGLYLVEEVKGGKVVWMGCRRFDIRPDCTLMDLRGDGDWRECSPALWGVLRVAGAVRQVFKPAA